MPNIHVVAHPLVQHKLTLMRQHDRSTKGFRELLNEVGMLLCYEVTRDLPTELVEIETPKIVNYGPAELYLEVGGKASNRVRVYIEP